MGTHKLPMITSRHVTFKENNDKSGWMAFSKITSQIFISNQHQAKKWENISEYGITHVLSLYPHSQPFFESNGVTYKIVTTVADIADHSNSTQLLSLLPELLDFIHNALQDSNHKILIHCFMGQSRSVAITAGYLCTATGL